MHTMSFVRTTLLALFAVCCSSSQAAIDPAKAADIREVLRLTGAESNVQATVPMLARSLAQMIKASYPALPEGATAVIQRELTTIFAETLSAPGGLMERMEPVYDQAFSHAEIRELLAFYATPIGQKLIARQPVIIAQSAEIGQKWGQSLGPLMQQRITEALKREGMLK